MYILINLTLGRTCVCFFHLCACVLFSNLGFVLVVSVAAVPGSLLFCFSNGISKTGASVSVSGTCCWY